MRLRKAVAVLAFTLLPGQGQIRPEPDESKEARLPSGKLQRDEILKADHARNLEDASELLKMAEELKIELEKNDQNVLSLGALKKTENIEKLAKRIRGRIKK